MKAKSFIIAAALTITACAGGPTPEQQARWGKEKIRDLAFAEEQFKKHPFHAKMCSGKYKRNMHDPESLEWVTEWEFEKILSGIIWKASDYRDYTTASSRLPNRRVAFARTLRGRNSYGGKVLGTAYCHFEVRDDIILIIKSSSDEYGYE